MVFSLAETVCPRINISGTVIGRRNIYVDYITDGRHYWSVMERDVRLVIEEVRL